MAMTHRRREQIARAKGFRSYREYRAAPAAERERSTRALARRDESYRQSGAAELAGQPQRRRGRQQVFRDGERTAVRSVREDVLQSQLRKAAKRGQQVRVTATMNAYTGDTSVKKTVQLFQRGGWAASAFLKLVSETKAHPRKYPQPGGVRSAILVMIAAGLYPTAPEDLKPGDVTDVQLFLQ